MNLGIVADEIDRDFRNAVRIGKQVGLSRFEVRFLKTGRAPMCHEEEMREVEQIARGEGVEITAISPGLFKWTDTPGDFSREMKEVYPRAVEWAQRWRLPGLIVFGFHKPGATEENGPSISSDQPPRLVIDWLAEAGTRATADGLVLMIEPEPICWADNGPATASLIRLTGRSNLKINYDPGNVAWARRCDPIDEFDKISTLIANVHIKDVLWKATDRSKPEFVPAGEGMIDYSAHFARLQRSGYHGPISLEPHMDGSEATIRRCKEACQKLWQNVCAS